MTGIILAGHAGARRFSVTATTRRGRKAGAVFAKKAYGRYLSRILHEGKDRL